MSNKKVLCKQISCVRTENMPSQPQSLQDVNIPTNLCITISGEPFLIKELIFNEENIIIFCIASNLQHLQKVNF
jgi:hypothetical protein